MPIEFKNAPQLLSEAYDRLITNTSITNLTPGGTARAILEIIAELQADQNVQLQENVFQAFVSRASGRHLELLGEVFGINRRAATLARDNSKSNFRFTIDKATGMTAADLALRGKRFLDNNLLSDSNILPDGFNIPQGTVVSTVGGIEYVTTELATLTGPETEVFIDVIATELGDAGKVGANQLTQHNISDISVGFTEIGRLITCTNPQPITSGTERESDRNLRFRISRAAVGSANANETSIRLAALAVPGVRDVRIRPFSFGIGTFSVFILGDHPIVSDGLLGAVRESVKNKAAAGIRVLTQRPTYRGVKIKIALHFRFETNRTEKTTINRNVRQVIADYINNIEIGGTLIINELIQRVLDVDEKIRDLQILEMSIGNFEVSSSTNKQQNPVLPANQSLEWDEQFYTNSTLVNLCEVV